MPDVASSNLNYFGIDKCSEEEGEECPAGYHVFGWRDYFDVYVRWRQVSISAVDKSPFDVIMCLVFESAERANGFRLVGGQVPSK